MFFLLIVIYIAFIGLGVPDSLIGSAWPAIHVEMDIPVESVSIITLLISGCTVLSSMFSARILNILGTAKVTAISTAITAAALLGFSVTPSFWFMIPLAVLLGLGAGAIDSGLNNYVAIHCKASHMNFLHCFYGVGVTLSPYLMSQALSDVWCGPINTYMTTAAAREVWKLYGKEENVLWYWRSGTHAHLPEDFDRLIEVIERERHGTPLSDVFMKLPFEEPQPIFDRFDPERE